ncbi:MAG: hypothetical protein RJA22_2068 [Verrucomicrobiota bacterium]
MNPSRILGLSGVWLGLLAWLTGVGVSAGVDSIPVGPGGQLYFHGVNGHIEVVTGTGDEVAVEVLGEAALRRPPPQVRLTREGSRVKVSVTPSGLKARFLVRVPARFNLDLQSSSGSITVSNLHGNVRARTAVGPINLGEVRGDVDAEGAAGSIALRRATGSVRLRTSGGNVLVGEAGGAASLETAGGGIRVLVARALVRARTAGGGIRVGAAFGAVDARTAGGSIAVNFLAQPREECGMHTEGGSVEARVAKDVGFQVLCENPASRIVLNLPAGWNEKPLEVRGMRREGTLRAGGPRLYLRSAGAGVWLEQAAEIPLPNLDKEFEFFQPGQRAAWVQAARVAPRAAMAEAQAAARPGGPAPHSRSAEERPRPKDEFALGPEFGPTLEPGILLPDGSLVPAEILSADDTEVVFRRVGIPAEPETLLVSRVAVLLFQPVPAGKLGLLRRPAVGLVLRNGDFVEGDFQSLQRNQVHLTSVLFGVRRVRIENSVIALALRPFRTPAMAGPAPAPVPAGPRP